LSAAPDLTRIYVPIGLGSGACGVLMAKAALQHSVQVIGVVSSHAPTYLQSIMKGHPIASDSAETIADGLAVREANPEALSWLRTGLSKVMSVTDDEVTEAMRVLLKETHNLVEGAGAAPFAAALRDQASIADGESIGVVISGGNVSSEVLKQALEEG
jgi:threonine dehydratase